MASPRRLLEPPLWSLQLHHPLETQPALNQICWWFGLELIGKSWKTPLNPYLNHHHLSSLFPFKWPSTDTPHFQIHPWRLRVPPSDTEVLNSSPISCCSEVTSTSFPRSCHSQWSWAFSNQYAAFSLSCHGTRANQREPVNQALRNSPNTVNLLFGVYGKFIRDCWLLAIAGFITLIVLLCFESDGCGFLLNESWRMRKKWSV